MCNSCCLAQLQAQLQNHSPNPNRTENGVLRIPIRELHYCQEEEKVLLGEQGVFHQMSTIWHIEFKEGFVKPAVAQRNKNKKVPCSPTVACNPP